MIVEFVFLDVDLMCGVTCSLFEKVGRRHWYVSAHAMCADARIADITDVK